jgi:predicted negative regulator of RcsB-dependent stress response
MSTQKPVAHYRFPLWVYILVMFVLAASLALIGWEKYQQPSRIKAEKARQKQQAGAKKQQAGAKKQQASAKKPSKSVRPKSKP